MKTSQGLIPENSFEIDRSESAKKTDLIWAICLREFVSERLTAAAEEIFRVFKQTVVQYEEEIDRQRRLLDSVWKPEVFHRIGE